MEGEKIEAGSTPREIYLDERGRFRKGNPGKPKGARMKTTRMLERLLADRAADVVCVVLERALAGDPTALRLVLDRVLPARRDPPLSVPLELPELRSRQDAAEALARVLGAVASGDVTPSEGLTLAGLIRSWCQAHGGEAPDGPIRIRWLDPDGETP